MAGSTTPGLRHAPEPPMRSAAATTMHTSELITAEIEGRYGFFPSIFAPAVPTPDVLEALWRQTTAAYLDNPLPAMFKERLFAYLSRVRGVAYCVVTHSCELRALGATGEDVVHLLEPLLGDDPSSAAHLLGSGVPPGRWPPSGSYEEARIVTLAAHAFMRDEIAEPCLDELRRLLGPGDLDRLVLLLGHIESTHGWVRAHPEITCEDDARVLRHRAALVREEPRLCELFDAVSPLRNASRTLIGVSPAARDAGGRTRRERYLQTVDHATRLLARSGTVDETLPAVLRVIGEGMGWAVGSAWMPTRRHGILQLRCAAFWHTPALDGASFETTSRRLRLDAGEGLPGRVWEASEARWVADLTAEPHSRRARKAGQDGLRTCCLLPVRGRDGVVAVVEFLSREIRPPDPILLEMLNRAAGRIGEYLERKGAAPAVPVGA
jgi:hypothetical protein